jgi:hypothetical protein
MFTAQLNTSGNLTHENAGRTKDKYRVLNQFLFAGHHRFLKKDVLHLYQERPMPA